MHTSISASLGFHTPSTCPPPRKSELERALGHRKNYQVSEDVFGERKDNRMKALLILTITLTAAVALTGCTDADVASRNLSRAAENFEIDRRIVFYNGVTGRLYADD